MKLAGIFGGVALIALIVAFGAYKSPELGSVTQSNEYKSFTATTTMGNQTIHVKDSAGSLGSIVITSSSASQIFIYDAPSVSSTPTSTVAVFEPNALEGTYTFDVSIYNGLVIVTPSTFNGTFTATYR